jgi:probable rRNA maturation factor
MAVLVSGTARARGIDRRRIRRKAATALEAIDLGALELSVVLATDDEIRRLNRDYRGKDRATDVLAFSLREGRFGAVAGALGDVVISLPTARRQAFENGFTIEEEVDRLLVHGILHLAGYDHERPAEARRMRRKEAAVGRRLRGPGD